MTDQPSPGKAKLEAYAKRVAARHAEVEEAFKGAIYSPADNRDYLKFVKDMTAEVACRYVMAGVINPLDEQPVDPGEVDKKAAELRQKGFTVSGDAKVAAEVAQDKAADPEGTKAVPDGKPEGDAAFLNSEFMRKTKELGFDPDADEESFPTTLRK